MAYIYLTIAVISEVIATSALHASKGFTVWQPTMVTCVGYLIAIYFLSLTMKSIPMCMTYAMWSGAGIVFISSVGWIFFKQHLDTAAMIGMAFIVSGIFIIQVFSHSTHIS
ncbi:multidrug efflux SMR transporter [Acinetobacter sp. ASP199]|uniref:DMT family transporter n=1 Tax=Acinetobacter sp. ASP199 TaxID=2773709 RepID=UPI001F622CF8|nr:multidrug efflux SMR transporter [Acinetobacter sp. ASP199]UNT60624.1 multidrug efflux SMR transporter [Acinetobacter sp. ASP199]